MKISVLINNYNYARFLGRAVASVQAQTRPADEVILVDDGSTDNSLEVARQCAAADPRVRVIAKSNGGQLSAFNAGFAVATGDIVAFLDADDEYLPSWLARLEQVYTRRPEADFIFCLCQIINGDSRRPSWERIAGDFDYGQTFFRAWLRGEWMGGPTSTISARRELLARFLPCALEARWRTRADDVLVMGASLMGGRKLQLGQRLVRYHVHGNNQWFGREDDRLSLFRGGQARCHLTVHLLDGLALASLPANRLAVELLREFRSAPRPRFADARHYVKLIRRLSGRGRVRAIGAVWLAWAASLRPWRSRRLL
jgi:glycosyltransferase involved in cell wall biosynthesis